MNEEELTVKQSTYRIDLTRLMVSSFNSEYSDDRWLNSVNINNYYNTTAWNNCEINSDNSHNNNYSNTIVGMPTHNSNTHAIVVESSLPGLQQYLCQRL